MFSVYPQRWELLLQLAVMTPLRLHWQLQKILVVTYLVYYTSYSLVILVLKSKQVIQNKIILSNGVITYSVFPNYLREFL